MGSGVFSTVFEVIDTRSFSSVWYWVMLALLWSFAIHWTLGAPYDLLRRACRADPTAQRDLERLVEVTARRRLRSAMAAGPLGSATLSALVTALALLGFAYGVELAQALLLMGGPFLAVWLFDQRVARRITSQRVRGDELCRRLSAARRRTQAMGMTAIFLVALWGMWWTLTTNPLAS